jgi:hypothetical protein
LTACSRHSLTCIRNLTASSDMTTIMPSNRTDHCPVADISKQNRPLRIQIRPLEVEIGQYLKLGEIKTETHNAAKLNNADGVGINPDSAIPRQLSVGASRKRFKGNRWTTGGFWHCAGQPGTLPKTAASALPLRWGRFFWGESSAANLALAVLILNESRGRTGRVRGEV